MKIPNFGGRLRIAGAIIVAILISSDALATGPLRHQALVGPNNALDSNGVGFFSLPPGIRPANRVYRSPFRNARPSYAVRRHGRVQQLIGYNSQIQHIVVIYMENRTPEDLFGAYWNTTNQATHNTFGTDLNVVNPQTNVPALSPMLLEGIIDPDHSHEPAFVNDAAGNWGSDSLFYVPTPAPGSTSMPEVANYISLIENWAYANTVLQSNEGPSFPAHQYAIAGQSGGLPGSKIAPNGLIENPVPTPTPIGNPEPDDVAVGGGSCATTAGTEIVRTTNMTTPYPGNENALGQATPPPCNEYQTIFDLMTTANQNTPAYDLWQYIAEDTSIIWSGPMAVQHLYNAYNQAQNKAAQPFAADPDAQNFVANLTDNNPLPWRPFANVTYITPCVRQSDHPNTSNFSNGPQWLAWVVNAIGESSYWPNTAIIVTWDDWGGFYDNYKVNSPPPTPWPYHPANNNYNNPSDPNEWGFRVPFLVISPWVTGRGYISSPLRSQGAILRFVEETFLPPDTSLGGDDEANGTAPRTIDDMFGFGRGNPGLPYVPLPTTFTPNPSGACPPAPM